MEDKEMKVWIVKKGENGPILSQHKSEEDALYFWRDVNIDKLMIVEITLDKNRNI
jgi:hypothetical protein